MKQNHTSFGVAVLLGAILLYIAPSGCQRMTAIERLAIQQQSALESGNIDSAMSLNEEIQALTGKTELPNQP